jgi:hypothetical protein
LERKNVVRCLETYFHTFVSCADFCFSNCSAVTVNLNNILYVGSDYFMRTSAHILDKLLRWLVIYFFFITYWVKYELTPEAGIYTLLYIFRSPTEVEGMSYSSYLNSEDVVALVQYSDEIFKERTEK